MCTNSKTHNFSRVLNLNLRIICPKKGILYFLYTVESYDKNIPGKPVNGTGAKPDLNDKTEYNVKSDYNVKTDYLCRRHTRKYVGIDKPDYKNV